MDKVIVEISARHVHVTQEHLETLFGKGYQLTPKKDLSQPGQFACNERVKVEGPKGSFPAVSILGPVRSKSQIELSLTDARSIGVAAPVRESGNVAGSAPCKLVGPCGEVELTEGVIAAKRHIHVSVDDAQKLGLKDQQNIKIKLSGTGRALVFDDVVCRVSDKFVTRVHLDTDEANAAGISGETEGEILL